MKDETRVTAPHNIGKGVASLTPSITSRPTKLTTNHLLQSSIPRSPLAKRARPVQHHSPRLRSHTLFRHVDVSRPVIHFHTPPDDTTLHSDSIHKNHPHLLLPIPLLDSFLRAPSTSSVTTTTPHSLDNVSGLNAPSRMTPPTTSLQHN